MGNLEGSVAVVTGAGRGLGRSIAEELGGEGASVVVNYANSQGPAEEVVSNLAQAGSKDSVAIKADVSDAGEASSLIEQTLEKFGRIDVLVNNAGITRDKSMKKLSTDDWDAVVQTNLNSCFYTVKAALTQFTEQGSGKIVNISSFVGQAGNFGQTNYAAAKAGIIGFTKAAAKELARYNVCVNAVCPGFIETDMFAGVSEEVQEQIRSGIPLARLGQPDEVARAVRYLVVEGDYITGQTLNINGGVYI
ncbi:3-oxoacyl-ACP reductase family protein [Rubrobacter aplysinae]|uniref:3-oxoacyl-ACP reductase family protein n=1 Tax=Rubrobacter aplysinae TaxID=909625 RepID=UPI00064BDDD6|nr:3-oxoacyl-ACP reductase family protein [Rubrobacter aplysinae]